MMRLKIGNGAAFDISSKGLELIKSPEMFGSNIKNSNIVTVDFPEEDGVRIYIPETPRKEAFDYAIKLGYYNPTLDKVKPTQSSVVISDFIESLIGEEVVIYNDYKGVQLTGIFKSYKDEGVHEGTKVVVFEITFLVPDPSTIVYY